MDINSDKLEFLSIFNVYGDNNVSVVVTTGPIITLTSNHIYVHYHCIRHHDGKDFVIVKIEFDNKKADIFTKGFQGDFFISIRKLLFSP